MPLKLVAFNGRNSPPHYLWGEIAPAEIGDLAARYGQALEETTKSKVIARGAKALADEIINTYPQWVIRYHCSGLAKGGGGLS